MQITIFFILITMLIHSQSILPIVSQSEDKGGEFLWMSRVTQVENNRKLEGKNINCVFYFNWTCLFLGESSAYDILYNFGLINLIT